MNKLTTEDHQQLARGLKPAFATLQRALEKVQKHNGKSSREALSLYNMVTKITRAKSDLDDAFHSVTPREVFEKIGHIYYDAANGTPTTDELRTALDESVRLQSHYAKLLNMHDGGERHPFADADEWIARLRTTGTLPPNGVQFAPPSDT